MQCPDQKKFFNGKELWKLFETPHKPENFNMVDAENLPQKRQNDNELLEMILANNTKEYDEKRILGDGDMCRVGELQRMRQHAQE